MATKTAQPKRVVHYAAAGKGLAFPCWHREFDEFRRRPASHTDLRRVTCPECWDCIGALARAVARDGLG